MYVQKRFIFRLLPHKLFLLALITDSTGLIDCPMTVYFVLQPAGHKADPRKHVLLMDEVDGMAGNEDRGGMQVRKI